MSRYMVIYCYEDLIWSQFFDSYKNARNHADTGSRAGALTELYEYETGEGYIRIA